MSGDDNHGRVSEIFLKAVALDVDERTAFLDRECEGDPSLRREVETLLAQDRAAEAGRATEAIAGRVHGVAAGVVAEGRPIPENLGPYRVLELLGEGGMGLVFRAEQVDPLRREVAIKLVRGGPGSEAGCARLEAERQTLARLSHPNIAAVLDAGTDAGRSYVVMELVRGVPILEYCRGRKIDIRDRLRLFLDVCRGVRHAHRRGVIHRDLKPSNVLVTDSSEGPVPKVIDFSIARLIEQSLLDTRFRTRTGQLVGTLAYMSPEQARGEIGFIDTRSDVYSLGVILYELLSDRLPYAVAGLPLHEVVRRISEDSPAALRDGPSGSTHRIDGDVETIVRKCLEKDPDRRYDSAAELAEDVRRFLEARPILARPPSTGYQLLMLVRRHRGTVAALGVVIVVLVAGATGTALGFLRARAEAEHARREASIAEGVNRFLNDDLLAAVAPDQLGIDVTMREVLDVAANRIGDRFPDQPIVEAAIRDTLGVTYTGLGAHREAVRHLERALELRRQHLGDLHPDTLDTMNSLGWAVQIVGDYERSGVLLRKAVSGRRAVLGPEDFATLDSVNNLAVVMWRLGRQEEAEALHRESLAIKRDVLGEDHPKTLASMTNLAIVLASQQRFEQAGPLFEGVLEGRRREKGPNHPATIRAMHNLARLYSGTGRHEEAEALFADLVEATRRVNGEGHPSTLSAMNELGNLYASQGRVQEAERTFLATFEARMRSLGEGAAATWQTLLNLGKLYERAGRVEDAERCYERAAEGQRRALGEDHPDRLLALETLGHLCVRTGRLEQAESLFRETLEAKRRKIGWDRPSTLDTAERLGRVRIDLGREPEADALLSEVLEARRRVLGPDHRDTLEAEFHLARVLAAEGELDRLAEALRDLVEHDWADRRLLEDRRFDGVSEEPDIEPLLAVVDRRLDGDR